MNICNLRGHFIHEKHESSLIKIQNTTNKYNKELILQSNGQSFVTTQFSLRKQNFLSVTNILRLNILNCTKIFKEQNLNLLMPP